MKTSKKVLSVKALILVVVFIGWFQVSEQIITEMEVNSNSITSEANTSYTANSGKTLKKNSLYYRYWEILKSRAKKHKV